MCDQATMIHIQSEIADRVDQDQMFTAFDVTLAVKERARLAGDQVPRHRHIKNDIHRELELYVNQNLYQKTLQDVGAPTQAFIYHPIGVDSASYVPLNRSDPAAQISAPLTQIASGTVDSDSDSDDGDGQSGKEGVDARGTLQIPVFILSSAGFGPKDTAYVAHQNGSKLVLARTPQANQITTYTVDYHGAVRITKFILEKAGLTGPFKFERDSDKVYIFSDND